MKKLLTIITLAIGSMTMMAQGTLDIESLTEYSETEYIRSAGGLDYWDEDILTIENMSFGIALDEEGFCYAKLIDYDKDVSFQSVTIPESIIYQGITIPVISIRYWAFSDCTSLTSITIPNGVEIERGAFYNCSSLKSVTIPDGVTSIGDYAFWGCSALTSITIPKSVTEIGKQAFDSTGIYNNESNWKNGALCIDGCLVGVSKYIPPYTYTISDCVRLIASGTFENRQSLKSISIPNSVTSIGDCAFKGCTSLTSIIIPNSVTWIGDDVFYGCSSLTSFTIPNSVTSIGDYAFKGCTSLTSIIIPNSVTWIGDGAFEECKSLVHIDILNSEAEIGEGALAGCESLTSIVVGNKVFPIKESTY